MFFILSINEHYLVNKLVLRSVAAKFNGWHKRIFQNICKTLLLSLKSLAGNHQSVVQH